MAFTDFTQYFKKQWNNTGNQFPGFEKIYSGQEKRKREKLVEEFQRKLKDIQLEGNDQSGKGNFSGSFFYSLRQFLRTVFDYSSIQLDIIFSEGFTSVTRKFFREARLFDKELKPEDIYQACRNVWIMNGIQLMINKPVELTPSVFGYSLIYPYSDNLLDDPAVLPEVKSEFSRRFRARLEGRMISPGSYTEEHLYRLVELIESQYPREKFPDVYSSLYAIHEGQTRSLELFRDPSELTDEEVLEISFSKGGASVLADGYLVAGELREVEERALFGYGVYLQLLDDIQDVDDDCAAGMRTIFSGGNISSEMDSLVRRTINFGRVTLNELKCFAMPEMGNFIGLMNKSVENMIIESIGLNEACYSSAFLKEMEKYSPLSWSFIRKKKSQDRSRRLDLFRKFFAKDLEEQQFM